MMQDVADALREWLAIRYQRAARRNFAKRDFWRGEVERPWQRLIPRTLGYMLFVVILGLAAAGVAP